MTGADTGLAFLVVGAADGEWTRRGATPIEARDLGLATASGGRLGGAQLRNTGDTSYGLDWHCHDNELHFVYVLGGSFVLELDSGPERMVAGSAAVLPSLVRHKEYGFSGDFAGLMATSPAVFDTIPDGGELPERATTLDPGLRPSVSHEAPGAYERGAGPFLHRDLGAVAVNGGEIHIRIVRAAASGDGDGASESNPAEWLLVLDGECRLELDNGSVHTFRELDSACLAKGVRRRLTATTDDFRALELLVV